MALRSQGVASAAVACGAHTPLPPEGQAPKWCSYGLQQKSPAKQPTSTVQGPPGPQVIAHEPLASQVVAHATAVPQVVMQESAARSSLQVASSLLHAA